MTNEAIEILKAARKKHVHSLTEFGMWQRESESPDCDSEMLASFEAAWRDSDSTCRGLLKAYSILTGRKIYPHQIKEELTAIS